MISVFLRDALPRLGVLAVVVWILYLLEPGFHQHGVPAGERPAELGPLGVSATLAYLAGLAMIILLAGFISADRRRGYARLFFSHPTAPLAFYALRWGIAYGLALTTAVLFLTVGQWIAWGEFRGGWAGLLLPLLTALIYGGLMAFLSAVLPRGDAGVVFVLFLPTFFPQILILLEPNFAPALWRLLLFLLPPQTALQEVYQALLQGQTAWDAAAFAAGYGAVWLGAAGVVLRLREWP